MSEKAHKPTTAPLYEQAVAFLKRSHGDDIGHADEVVAAAAEAAPPMVSDPDAREGLTCLTCGLTFASVAEQRQHFRSDLHRLNVKRKVKRLPPVTEEEFELMDDEDLSSISGSDTESEPDEPTAGDEGGAAVGTDTAGTQVCYANESGRLLYVWKSIVEPRRKAGRPQAAELGAWIDRWVERIEAGEPVFRWMVMLCSAGHFAGAIIDRGKVLAHKTFHRYTVRRKAGTRQSAYDSQGRAAQSAGSNLRRYNEQALTAEIMEWVASVSELTAGCSLIFVQSPQSTRTTIFGKDASKSALSPDDPRIRAVPFQTKRPTYSEAQRVYQRLSTVTHVDAEHAAQEAQRKRDEQQAKIQQKQQEQQQSKAQKKAAQEKEAAAAAAKAAAARVPEPELPESTPLHAAAAAGDVAQVQGLLGADGADAKELLASWIVGGLTPLHSAAAADQSAAVAALLNAGADPTRVTLLGRTPYQMAKGKATRDEMRRYMGRCPDAWDYGASHIPSPLTEEAEAAKAEAARQKAREKRRRKKEREKLDQHEAAAREEQRERELREIEATGLRIRKEEEERVAKAEQERVRSQRELRALAAERRLRAMQQQQ